MSRLIDSRRLKGLTDEQRASLRQEAEIKELYHHRDQLYHRIRTSKFKFLYRAKEESIHDEYQEVKRVVNRLIKARERALKKQVQAEYDVIASMNDIQAQLEGNAKSIDQTVPIFGSIRYAFVERARIAQAFFDSPSAFDAEGDVGWRVSIVDDLMSLCSLQEGRFRKVSRRRRIRVIECDLKNVDAKYTLNAVMFKSAESESQVPHLFSLRCKQYQCLLVLEIAVYLWMSDFITLVVNFRCDGISAAVILACAESSAFLDIHFCVTPRSLLYGEFENPTPPPLQLPKIEAIQTSLFVDVPDVLATVFIRNASTPKSKSTSR